MFSRLTVIPLSLLFVLAAIPGMTFAHGPVARASEAETTQARLFTADAATGEIVAIDLPGGAPVFRLSTPPYLMALALSSDRQHLFAMRGRNTDRDWVTVIDTGFDPDTREVRPPYVARTVLANAPTTGGRHDGMISTVGGRDALYMDTTAEIIVFEEGNFSGYGEVALRRYSLAQPDHYHAMEAGENLYIGHLRSGFVQVLNRDSGREVARIPGCPALHGMAEDRVSGRIFFGCGPHVLVVGTQGDETGRKVAQIAYPASQRVAAFLAGKERILWGYTEGTLPMFYRLDMARRPYEFETIPVESSVQYATSGDGRYLLVLTRAGVLEIRDGGNGKLQRSVPVTAPFAKDFHEHTDKAVLPDILVAGGSAYVSLPNEGRIAQVDIDRGKVLRRLEVGGEPTRLILVMESSAR